MKTKKTKKIKVVESLYKATILIMGKEYNAEAPTIPEALFKLNPEIKKGRSILIIEKDDYKKERILQPTMTFRLFNTRGLMKDIAIKNITNLFI